MGIGIPYLFIKLFSCHGFMKNTNYLVILLCPSRMLGYCFSKGFVMLERNSNNLFIIENEVKQIIHAMDMNDSDYVMTFTTAIPSISINLNKLWIKSGFHSSYIKTIYNGE